MQRKYRLIGVFIMLLIGVNILSAYFSRRFDFTKDKRFTLHEKTKELLKSNKKEIVVTLFLDGDIPAPFKRLKQSVVDLLTNYNAESAANIRIQIEDPLSNVPSAELRDSIIYNLAQVGIVPTSVNIKTDQGFIQKLVFPMAMIESDGKQMPVRLLQNLDPGGNYEEHINKSIQNLEYVFTTSIKKVQTGINPRIGFTEGNGELNDELIGDAINTLGVSYQVGRVNLSLINKAGLDKLKLLIVAKPTRSFTESDKYKLNYFLMKGGSLVFSVDQVDIALDSLFKTGSHMALNKDLNLNDLLFTYGTRINYNLIADANNAEIPLSTGSKNASQLELLPWPFYPVALPDTANLIVKNVDGIKTEFTSTVDTLALANVKKSILLKSSRYNIVFPTPKVISLQHAVEQVDPKTFTGVSQNVGVLLEGSFPSLFLNRPIPEGIDEDFNVPDRSTLAKLIVIGDGDIFKNQLSSRDGSAFPLGFDRFSQRNFGNKVFLENIADYMTDNQNFIELRNKELKIRLLDKMKIKNEKLYWQLLNIILPLLLLIIPAIFQHYYRKYKYAK